MKKSEKKISAMTAAVINPNDEDIKFIDLRVDYASSGSSARQAMRSCSRC